MLKKQRSTVFSAGVVLAYFVFLYLQKNFLHSEEVGFLFLNHIFASVIGLFFMVAGFRFIDSYTGDIFKYYVKKGFRLLVPLFVASWLILMGRIGFSVSLTYLKDVCKGIIFRTICEEYWIYYYFFGVLLVAPFIKRMAEGLSEKDKRWLLGVLIGVFALFTCDVWFNIKFTFSGYPFLNWMTFSICGYLMRNISWEEKEKKIIYVSGVVALAVSTAEAIWFSGRNWVLDSFCVTRLLMCMALFLFFTEKECLAYKEKKGTEFVFYGICLLIPLLMEAL